MTNILRTIMLMKSDYAQAKQCAESWKGDNKDAYLEFSREATTLSYWIALLENAVLMDDIERRKKILEQETNDLIG